MDYNPMGHSGLKLSRFALGGWTTFGGSVSEQRQVNRLIHLAHDHGVNYFDTADIYDKGASEIAMGRALGSLPRHHVVLASKVFWPMSDDVNDRGLSRKHIIESVNASLRRLGTDYLDLYFCHRYDSETPLEETLRAMDDLVRQGKVLYWGTSEWNGEAIHRIHGLAAQHGCHAPRVEQPQYSLLARGRFENDVLPACRQTGMGSVVWSPLASGFLSGKYDEGIPAGTRLERMEWLRKGLLKESNQTRMAAFRQLAAEMNISRTQLALAWTARMEGVSSVILGATSEEQLLENLMADRITLDAPVLDALDRIFEPGINASDPD